MTEVLRNTESFDLERLAEEVSIARGIMEFRDGPYGNCISLPAARDVSEPFRNHHNNVPFADALESCPYIKQIFDSFLTEKASCRLLRRKGATAYALHDDKDKGVRIHRFQIPILTNSRAFLLIPTSDANFGFAEAEKARGLDGEAGDVWFDLERLDRELEGRFQLFTLQPGFLYYFDTDQIHTLINAGNSERIVLSIDLVVNDWLNDWMRTELTQRVSPEPVPRTSSIAWEWNALRCGVIRNA
jgi:hypothetical protein